MRMKLGRAFDPSRSLPEAFEVAQGDADRQADLLRADAARAVGFEECVARIESMEDRRREIAVELTAFTSQHQELQATWSQQLAEGRLPSLDPDALREWQTARQVALDIAKRLAKSGAGRDHLLVAVTTATSTVIATLQAVGQTAQGSALSSLIDQAGQWDKLVTAAEAEHSARTKAATKRRVDREKIEALITKTDTELGNHATAVQAWHTRLFLTSESAPDAVKARLDELDRLARQSAMLGDARLRQAQQQAVVDEFVAQAANLAMVLGEQAPSMVDDFADNLRRRLAVTREHEQQRLALNRDRIRAQNTKRSAEAEQESQSIILARLCTAAGVEVVERLPEQEDSASRKRLAQGTLATQRQQLAQASTRSVDDLRERLAGQDAIAMDSEREQCRVEIERLEQEQSSARKAEEETRRALEAIDSSDRAATAREAMESAAARYRSAIRPWARLRLAHALLQEALNRFRERAQAPMVAAASTYFSLMSGGRYLRLVADEENDNPVLRAERADGVRIGVEAMSDGTADQLYLALRLAALELRRGSHPLMPLVLDDVLITSDDERAANILRALAQFSEGGQVMLFTHHRHLIDVARGVLDEQVLAIHNL